MRKVKKDEEEGEGRSLSRRSFREWPAFRSIEKKSRPHDFGDISIRYRAIRATLDTSVRLFGDVIFFIRIVGIIAKKHGRSSELRSLDMNTMRKIRNLYKIQW